MSRRLLAALAAALALGAFTGAFAERPQATRAARRASYLPVATSP